MESEVMISTLDRQSIYDSRVGSTGSNINKPGDKYSYSERKQPFSRQYIEWLLRPQYEKQIRKSVDWDN